MNLSTRLMKKSDLKKMIELLKLAGDSIVCIIADEELADTLDKAGIDSLTIGNVMPGFQYGSSK